MPPKPPWFYNQSGVIPFRIRDDAIEILLVTTKRRKRWIVPKGIVEQEALEEAGVRGRVHATPIEKHKYDKWGGRCRVEVFLMEVTEVLEQWAESGFRERKWVRPEEAAALVDEPELKQVMRNVSNILYSE